jgi:hypothetical protein
VLRWAAIAWIIDGFMSSSWVAGRDGLVVSRLFEPVTISTNGIPRDGQPGG